MTVYLECPPAQINALRALYNTFGVRGKDNPNEDEGIGVMRIDATGTRAITGTTRASAAKHLEFVAAMNGRPWLKIHDEWPADWQF